jgi:hypothetical protein
MNRQHIGALAAAGVLQLLLLLAAVWIGVVRPQRQEAPVFAAGVPPAGIDNALQREASLAAVQRATGGAAALDRLLSQSLLAEALPGLPVPTGAWSTDDTGAADLGTTDWVSAAGTAMAGATRLSLFGLEVDATRVVLAIDISASVKTKVERAGWSMAAVRDEALRQVRALNADTLFGLIQFARRYDLFAPHLLPATAEARVQAETWLQNRMRVDGSSGRGWTGGAPDGIETVLRAAFALDPKPDLLVIVSDGDFQRSRAGGGGEDVPWDDLIRLTTDLQRALDQPCRIDCVVFELKPEHRAPLQRWLRPYGGRLIEPRRRRRPRWHRGLTVRSIVLPLNAWKP